MRLRQRGGGPGRTTPQSEVLRARTARLARSRDKVWQRGLMVLRGDEIEHAREHVAPIALRVERGDPDVPLPSLRARERAYEPLPLDAADVPPEHDAKLGAPGADLGRPGSRRAHLHLDAVEEVAYRLGRRAVAVAQLLAECAEIVERRQLGDASVRLELALAAWDVLVRDRRRQREVHRHQRRGGRARGAALFVHRFLEELRVELEADRGDVAVLLGAEDVPCPADLEVLHRDLEAGAELARFEHRLEALAGLLIEVLLLCVEQVGVGLLGASSDAAAELVELG